MKLIKITSKNGQYMESPQTDVESGLQLILSDGSWGLPERWLPHKDEGGSYDDADVIDERLVDLVPEVPLVPAKPAVYDNGNLLSEAVPEVPAVPAVTQKQVKLRAEYTVEIEDITAKLEQDKINAESLKYLASTDWLIIRELDSGMPCPAEIKALRQAAREAIK